MLFNPNAVKLVMLKTIRGNYLMASNPQIFNMIGLLLG